MYLHDPFRSVVCACPTHPSAATKIGLEKGADVEATERYGGTSLVVTATRGHKAVVRLLLEKGADIGATDHDGVTALVEAAAGGHKAVVWLLTPLTLLDS
jgi:ankyrin repeat protein